MINSIPKPKVLIIRNKGKLIIVLFSCIAFIPLYINGITEQAIRECSLIFQLLGISTIILGIHETRKSFDHPPLIDINKCINKYINKAKALLGIRHNYKEYIGTSNAQYA